MSCHVIVFNIIQAPRKMLHMCGFSVLVAATMWSRGAGCSTGNPPFQAVVDEAKRILGPLMPLLNTPLVGAKTQLQKVQRLLALTPDVIASEEVRVVGMHGMGGVGKSTLATKVHDEALPLFRGGRIVRVSVGNDCNAGCGLEAKRSELLRLLDPGPRAANIRPRGRAECPGGGPSTKVARCC